MAPVAVAGKAPEENPTPSARAESSGRGGVPHRRGTSASHCGRGRECSEAGATKGPPPAAPPAQCRPGSWRGGDAGGEGATDSPKGRAAAARDTSLIGGLHGETSFGVARQLQLQWCLCPETAERVLI